ncbi:hypothetical protein NQ317_015937 [Molorchus minor]|uniref:Uncharacterized protein n=1 Tax=Molorchus minor TaxID=1323400 RepID=A0ABQ9JL29_9CUCU|nr:hypothetical protein NQ317_015937 [Molorchus minor]
MRLADNKQDKERTNSPRRKPQKVDATETMKAGNIEHEKGMEFIVPFVSHPVSPLGGEIEDLLVPETTKKGDKATNIEKRVSFERATANRINAEKSVSVLRTQSLNDSRTKERRVGPIGSRSLPEDHSDNLEEIGATSAEVHFAKEETAPVELCDIEPLSGTVFRKVTVRRRRQENMRKIPAVDTGE